jgi:hypothetical protein
MGYERAVARFLALTLLAGACTAAPAGVGVNSDDADQQVTTFWLPTGSPRLGAATRVNPRTCVTLVWSFHNRKIEQHCDDFAEDFPYAVVATGAHCADVWDYRPNSVVQSIHGCITPATDGAEAELDITATISGEIYVGELHLVTR